MLRHRLRVPGRPRHRLRPERRATALLLGGTLAATALWGAIGVALGTIVRNQVGAIIGLLAWGFVAENLLFALVPDVGRLGPVHAQDALIGLTTTTCSTPPPAPWCWSPGRPSSRPRGSRWPFRATSTDP